MAQEILIAMGGNIPSEAGSPQITLARALGDLVRAGLGLVAVSRFFSTPCFPAGAGPDYVNAAVSLRSSLAPEEILAKLHAVEAAHGRERQQRWGQRTLDLDLVAVGDRVIPDMETFEKWHKLDPAAQASAAPDRLVLPHPRLQDRAFVLVPLADIAPGWVHPVLGLSVAEMLAALPASARAEVTALD